jgi:protease-4
MNDNTPKKRKNHGCMWAVIIVAILAGAAVLLFGAGLSLMSNSINVSGLSRATYGSDEFPEFKERWSYGHGETKVVMIPLRGVIFLDEDDGFFGSDPGAASTALKSIHRATADQKVKAIILDIDSGGGGITASDVLLKALLDFRKSQPDRRVVSVFGDVAASGAYYVALGSDRIVARPTALTGSIGVLMQTINIKELSEKIGVRDVTIKSGRNKDILNPFSDLSEEQRAMLQGIIDKLHERFMKLVAEHRSMPIEKVREIADGRVFLADEAVQLGLIDEVGYWEDSVAATAGLLGVEDIKVYRYERGFTLSGIFSSASLVNPGAWLRRLPTTRFLYAWQP